ncbi:MAG: hypothetical protein ACYC7D_00640 [Nitrososphaerales archaeon]
MNHWIPSDTSGFDEKKEDALKESQKLSPTMEQFQVMLYPEHKQNAIIVQAMETGGEDGTI